MEKFVIGLSGGIGSGKTAVSDIFKKLGIEIVDADLCSRIVVEKGKPALEKIATHFGQGILLEDGSLNRALLREKIFSNREEKKWLEQLLHPLILEELLTQLANTKSAYVILVSPLLVESGQNKLCHKILIVDATESAQLERTMQRDNNSQEQVEAIMSSQASRQQRLTTADYVIENNSTLKELETKVQALHQIFLIEAANRQK